MKTEKGHDLPDRLHERSSAACRRCGKLARQETYRNPVTNTFAGVGEVEWFSHIEKTGPRPHDNEGVWTAVEPDCITSAPPPKP